MVLAGVFALPYGYYQLLRLVVCSWAIWALVSSWKVENGVLRWLLIGLALLFNPVRPVHLTKTVWACVDVATAAILLVYARYHSTKKPQ